MLRGSPLNEGFADPVGESQRTFRVLLDALSRPGRIAELPVLPRAPEPLSPAAAAICLTLVDLESPVWLDEQLRSVPAVADYLRFHCGCPIVEAPETARFAVVDDPAGMADLERFDQGSLEYPDRSATLVVQVAALDGRRGRRLAGPGIGGEQRLCVEGPGARFWDFLAGNRERFPLGLDVFCVTDRAVVGLPRTVELEG
jgi:alpha-D-ribose 1-methylphosphonate 5-triphosphate synthase subunit PhnH